ncbi:uncharacterized protein SAPINGB_P005803 [Magnusiomyces paraingens]|uniref:Uncharacterized protein n=1 Tax=Magnusiomyces paraingens TaxID=2606893 RepID=A0A5E8C1P4_9ASCO|nr:uncharacterized protein SAPINGB_P005803 [Saprochaete ingens]VVT57654.1 unnamed protein product [Saprochaete ingens]
MSSVAKTFETVAVIGAGPSGLAVTKALLGEKLFSKIKVFERQNQPGGVWNYSKEKQATPLVPSIDAFAREPTVLNDQLKRAVYTSPIYKNLDTNIPHFLMRYHKHDFKTGLEAFPKKEDVLEYVQNYAKPIEKFIRFNSDVQSVSKSQNTGKWTIEYTDYTQGYPKGTQYKEDFDAVVVSNGHYDLPFLPKVKGMSEWVKKYPGSIQHAKYFNDPKEFAGKNIVIVGNASSGVDISLQVAEYAKNVYRSIVSKSYMPYASNPRILDVPTISEYKPETKEIVLNESQDKDTYPREYPKVLTDVDVVLYCTGYLYTYPFLKTYMEPGNPDSVLQSTGERLHRVYENIFYIPDPSLSFVGVPKQIIPFPLAELESAVIARVYSGRLALPSVEEMLEKEKETEEKVDGNSARFHSYSFPHDVEHYRKLEQWVREETKDSKVLPHDKGFFAEPWGQERYDQRGSSFELKASFIKEKAEKKKLEQQQKL